MQGQVVGVVSVLSSVLLPPMFECHTAKTRDKAIQCVFYMS